MSSYIGKRFGKLLVKSLHKIERYTQENGTKQNVRYFLCECDCGEEKIIRQPALHSQSSCGCKRIESNKSRAIDLTGQKFNRLTAVSKQDSGLWACVCECGNEVSVKTASLRNGNTKSCGCLQKEHASSSMTLMLKARRRDLGKPEDIPMSADYKVQRMEFQKTASKILERDNYRCTWCSSVGANLNVHHIIPWAVDEQKRFDPNNLVTLCVSCHMKVHQGNYHKEPDSIMSILLQGYVNIVDDYDWAARLELGPN